jgi:hypothetical protein
MENHTIKETNQVLIDNQKVKFSEPTNPIKSTQILSNLQDKSQANTEKANLNTSNMNMDEIIKIEQAIPTMINQDNDEVREIFGKIFEKPQYIGKTKPTIINQNNDKMSENLEKPQQISTIPELNLTVAQVKDNQSHAIKFDNPYSYSDQEKMKQEYLTFFENDFDKFEYEEGITKKVKEEDEFNRKYKQLWNMWYERYRPSLYDITP